MDDGTKFDVMQEDVNSTEDDDLLSSAGDDEMPKEEQAAVVLASGRLCMRLHRACLVEASYWEPA